MTTVRAWRFVAAAACGVWLAMAGRAAGQTDLTVTPANPTLSVGQTQQFGVGGAVTPTGVSAGGEYTCVRLSDGTVRCTGRNQFGQHADGTQNNSSTLVAASGPAGVSAVIAGDEFGCALFADGSARCWGLGEKGQRGDGTFVQVATTPVAVSGITTAAALAAGYNHACALLADGTVRCWGDNSSGQLGDPSTSPGSAVPVAVSGITGAVAIAAGAFHSCALLADATLRCWGSNGQGQLGDGTLTDSATPVAVSGLSGVTSVTGGGHHTCAVIGDGTVQCWGDGYDGQLGQGAFAPSSTPVPVAGITTAAGVSGGWAHTCARLGDGSAWCWGDNSAGQLGNGTTQGASVPVRVASIAAVVGITSGWWHHSCVLLADASVQCWGENTWGQLGNGTTSGTTSAARMIGTGITWTTSNAGVAAVDASGLATAVGSGFATITATDAAGWTGSSTPTVRDRAQLSVTPAGNGAGAVSSSPAGIACGATCAALFDVASTVTLTATPLPKSMLAGWTGCDTVNGATCGVTMNAARTVSADFEPQRFTLTITKTGLLADQGSVTSSPDGISCGASCSASYTVDTVVVLTASPSLLFGGWTGCDAVSGATCTVTMSAAHSVTATFLTLPF